MGPAQGAKKLFLSVSDSWPIIFRPGHRVSSGIPTALLLLGKPLGTSHSRPACFPSAPGLPEGSSQLHPSWLASSPAQCPRLPSLLSQGVRVTRPLSFWPSCQSVHIVVLTTHRQPQVVVSRLRMEVRPAGHGSQALPFDGPGSLRTAATFTPAPPSPPPQQGPSLTQEVSEGHSLPAQEPLKSQFLSFELGPAHRRLPGHRGDGRL